MSQAAIPKNFEVLNRSSEPWVSLEDLARQLGVVRDSVYHWMMTATPHKGDPENVRLFLSLFDGVLARKKGPGF